MLRKKKRFKASYPRGKIAVYNLYATYYIRYLLIYYIYMLCTKYHTYDHRNGFDRLTANRSYKSSAC